MRKFIPIKEKVSLYSNQITFNYNQKCHPLHPRDTWYKQFPQKKKKKKRREKERKEVEKRRRRKGMERVCAEGKGKGRMRGGKKEERKEKENKGEKEREQKIERTAQGVRCPLRTHSLARS